MRTAVDKISCGVVIGPAGEPYQPASFDDGYAGGPAITDVGALVRRGAFFSAPFRNSSSSACLPTSRSRAAIRALYCLTRSAATAPLVQRAGLEPLDPDADQIAR